MDDNEEILITNMQTLFQIGNSHLGSMHEVQYVEYDENTWTVPVKLTKERLNKLWSDYSVKAVRLTKLVKSIPVENF